MLHTRRRRFSAHLVYNPAMADSMEPTLPWRARLPWFAVWVPTVLLLYTLVNGAGHILVAYLVLMCLPSQEGGLVLEVAAYPCGPLGFLIFPVLVIFASVSWKLCSQWSPGIRRMAGWLGIWLFLSFLLIQAILLCPR